jgi:hypothetical protein
MTIFLKIVVHEAVRTKETLNESRTDLDGRSSAAFFKAGF